MSYDTTPYLTAAQYAAAVDVSERTVKRWLQDHELPGAAKDERGRWMIPAEAERRTRAGDLVPMSRPTTRPTTDVSQTVDALPSFLTLDEAAQILGISRHAIATHRDYFDVVPFGANGSLVVPLATIKRIRG
jgi:hypothetical protein